MSLSGKVFKLSDGNTIPAIGYGTGTKWFKLGRNEIDENLVNTLVTALSVGATHIDGAEVYNTDQEIGLAIKKSGLKREDIYLTDKYFAGDSSYTAHSKEANPYESLKASLKRFQVDYVDLYLLHAPFIKEESHGFSLEQAWAYVEKLKDEGLAKSIGVSNFSKEDLDRILKVAKHKPTVNQIEYNAYLQEQTPGIVEYSQQQGLLVEAYSPLGPIIKGKPGPLDGPLAELAKKYGKDEGQVLLRWVLQNGVLPVTTSANKERIQGSLDVFDFELTKEEVEEISKLGKEKKLRQYWTKEYN
ncbi:NADPH-dependent conjugated polyketone reductase C1 [[Candida] anglica]|uniref:NADPH-dependent conjugated polyketone reductase C1 n=1 Tax=[Candida] anglica TaxID=148631 RepID=A0ABP0E940_9ASCO